MRRVSLGDVSIFQIKSGVDKVLNIETNKIGLLFVNETKAECLSLFVRWIDSDERIKLNQYDKKYVLLRDEV